jgi:hypothetical protein
VKHDRHVATAGGVAAAEPEQPAVLEEELALFRKEQAEPGEVDLLLVGFRLREIRVVGEVGGQVLGQAILHVDAEVRIRLVGDRRP